MPLFSEQRKQIEWQDFFLYTYWSRLIDSSWDHLQLSSAFFLYVGAPFLWHEKVHMVIFGLKVNAVYRYTLRKNSVHRMRTSILPRL